MPLKPVGKNAPIDDEARAALFAVGKPVDLATTPPRTTDINDHARPCTLEELTMLVNGAITSRNQLLELPWDEAHASALADRAMSANAHLAVVLLAGSGRYEEARTLYDRMDPDVRAKYASGGGHAALAVGDFEVPAHPGVREIRLGTMGTIVRFRPIADRIAAAADELIAKLPGFFGEHYVGPKYIEIWTPTLRSFALLSQSDEKLADQGFATLLGELSAVKVSKDEGFTYEDKRAALLTMFTLAMHEKRLVSAHRIASKFGTSYTDKYRLRVAAEYAKAGDLGGAWEIVKKMTLTKGYHFDHLAQSLRESASRT